HRFLYRRPPLLALRQPRFRALSPALPLRQGAPGGHDSVCVAPERRAGARAHSRDGLARPPVGTASAAAYLAAAAPLEARREIPAPPPPPSPCGPSARGRR